MKYLFKNLQRHTENIKESFVDLRGALYLFVDDAFRDFSEVIEKLEDEPPSLERNVKLILACKLLNHIYSGILLAESGLIDGAITCERNAMETIAYFWLVCLDPRVCEEYNSGKRIQPVEVRKKLEKAGIEVSGIRNLYSSESGIVHVGRCSERFISKKVERNKYELFFGGRFSLKDQGEMIRFLSSLFYLFETPEVSNQHHKDHDFHKN